MTRFENKLADVLDSLALDGYAILTSIQSHKIKEAITLQEDDSYILSLMERLENYDAAIAKTANDFRQQDEKEMGYNFCLTEVLPAIQNYVNIIYTGYKDIRVNTVSRNIAIRFLEMTETLKGLIQVLQRIYERKTQETVNIDYMTGKVLTSRS